MRRHPLTPPEIRFVLLPAVFAAALVLGGCSVASPTASGAASGEVPPAPAAPSPAASSASKLPAMSVTQVRSEIHTGFPVETPVPAGEVVRGAAQGPEAWDYELVVSAAPPGVAAWYRQTYASRSWAVTGERTLEGGGIELELQKGAAGTRVTVSPAGDGSRVVVVLGLGEAVLQSQ